MKFTKRMIVMTFLAMTATVSTGFAYDYVCNGSQTNCNTNTQFICNNNNTSQGYYGQNSNTRGCGGYRK